MEKKTYGIIEKMLPFVMADGLLGDDGFEFPANQIALHGALMICDENCNEIRASMMERLFGNESLDVDGDWDTLIDDMVKVSPYRFCLDRVEKGDLRKFLSNPSFLREAHRRWASASGFHSGPIVGKPVDWSGIRTEQVCDLQNAAATVEQVSELIQNHSGSCLSLARSILGNHSDAEDACQDAFLKSCLSAKGFDMDRNPSAYLATIVKNCCMTYHQRRNRLSMRSLFDFEGALAIEPVDNIDDLKEWESDDFFASVVQPEIDELSPNEIKVLHLRYQEGLTFDEIASQLDKQQGTVRSWFRRALLKLRVNCAADGDE